jgi:hypothetical protein
MYPSFEAYEAASGQVRDVCRQSIQALAQKLKASLPSDKLPNWAEQVLVPWLQVHRYAGRTRFDYPRGNNGLIYEYHTNQRRQHARGRKLAKRNPRFTPPVSGLISLDQLDAEDKKPR